MVSYFVMLLKLALAVNMALAMCVSSTRMVSVAYGLTEASLVLVNMDKTMDRFRNVCALTPKTSEISVVALGMCSTA